MAPPEQKNDPIQKALTLRNSARAALALSGAKTTLHIFCVHPSQRSYSCNRIQLKEKEQLYDVMQIAFCSLKNIFEPPPPFY